MLMRARRHLRPNEEDSFGIIASDSVMGLWKQLTGAIAASMVGIVSVFLVIGGVVIMNVMLASVTERTREIGIRIAVGAQPGDIRLQFLVEAMVLSVTGGLIGIALGTSGALAISRLVEGFYAIVSLDAILLATGFSAAVGLFFGLYPAWRAGDLNPIDALRYE